MPRTMDRLERAAALDGAADRMRSVVRAAPLGRGRDVLRGRWLGHPVHPLLVHVPIGAWLSAAVLDLLPGQRRAARTLVGVGLVGVAPAAVSGWVDWAELDLPRRRLGLAHAATNVAAVALYAASFAARGGNHTGLGRALGFAGLLAVGATGAIGGHLAHHRAPATATTPGDA
ncbi:DUF2231 domain-containing protein [Streptomyces flavochromogenes]|uniref:DUF2231 domain-containing protein n=1 Tax=Streptomyces flavochromogenes TaxID=68199 RepID=A0ABW6Y2S2_9ACTN|nr:DUF2231 domain-containing protein [Streptomyces flavochromogenes]